MLTITRSGSSIVVKGVTNKLYPDNATLGYPLNSVVVVTDRSQIAVFRSAANNDVYFSALISDIQIAGASVTKETIHEAFAAVANETGGGGGGTADAYTKAESDSRYVRQTNVKTINGNSIVGTGDITIKTSTEFPSNWRVAATNTMAQLCQDIYNDTNATEGKQYMKTIANKGLPTGVSNAEVVVNVMRSDTRNKVVLLTLTSSDVEPYHWEMTSINGQTGEWRGFVTDTTLEGYQEQIVVSGQTLIITD